MKKKTLKIVILIILAVPFEKRFIVRLNWSRINEKKHSDWFPERCIFSCTDLWDGLLTNWLQCFVFSRNDLQKKTGLCLGEHNLCVSPTIFVEFIQTVA